MKALTILALVLGTAAPALADDAAPDSRLDAVVDIGIDAEAAAFDLLLGLFEDSAADPLDRMQAAWALGEIGDTRAVEPLIAALERDFDERTGMMMAIIPALGWIGDARAVPLLLDALTRRDDHWLAREAAAEALGRIGATEAVPALLDAAWMADTRHAAVVALARIGDPAAVEVLASALADEEDPETSTAAADGLVAIGAPSVDFAAVGLETGGFDRAGPEALALIGVLGRIGGEKAQALLTALSGHTDPAVAEAARATLN